MATSKFNKPVVDSVAQVMMNKMHAFEQAEGERTSQVSGTVSSPDGRRLRISGSNSGGRVEVRVHDGCRLVYEVIVYGGNLIEELLYAHARIARGAPNCARTR